MIKPFTRLVIVSIVGTGLAVPAANAAPPLYNPTLLNIGFVCRWQAKCMDRQQKAMEAALKYVRKHDPPLWKVQQCNRNASRKNTRVDWIGYNNCIRNKELQHRPPRRSRA